jgi:tRNA(Arg) A34 adenosine deaminase TadA
MTREERFMQEAIGLAQKGVHDHDGGPFGCVIVKGDTIIGYGNNRVTSTNDPTAHAEVIAIRDACRNIGSFQLEGCEIYTSCEPCPMCLGAIYWARPEIIYYAGTREDASAAGFDDSMIYDEIQAKLSERKIPAVNLGRPGAREVFREWSHKKDKKMY